MNRGRPNVLIRWRSLTSGPNPLINPCFSCIPGTFTDTLTGDATRPSQGYLTSFIEVLQRSRWPNGLALTLVAGLVDHDPDPVAAAIAMAVRTMDAAIDLAGGPEQFDPMVHLRRSYFLEGHPAHARKTAALIHTGYNRCLAMTDKWLKKQPEELQRLLEPFRLPRADDDVAFLRALLPGDLRNLPGTILDSEAVSAPCPSKEVLAVLCDRIVAQQVPWAPHFAIYVLTSAGHPEECVDQPLYLSRANAALQRAYDSGVAPCNFE